MVIPWHLVGRTNPNGAASSDFDMEKRAHNEKSYHHMPSCFGIFAHVEKCPVFGLQRWFRSWLTKVMGVAAECSHHGSLFEPCTVLGRCWQAFGSPSSSVAEVVELPIYRRLVENLSASGSQLTHVDSQHSNILRLPMPVVPELGT